MSHDPDRYDEIDDIWDEMEAKADKQRRVRLWQHPDCRDPAHPGCSQCETQDNEED